MNSTPASELGRAGQLVAGKFRLDAIIGRGGMGCVWSATHVGLGHRLALKLIAREFIRSPEALRRFDAEAKAAARLRSRHVVQVFDNGTLDDGTPFIAMELLSGQNVSDRIHRGGPVPLGSAVEILAQCCKALGRAHAAGIVHRDIKPDNIFLAREPDEESDVVKILDFGVAKMALGVQGGSQVTGTGALLGTPLYMSPEQIRGLRGIDHRTDLYSLGLVAYTMLTGSVAVSGETFGDILVKICTEPLPSLTAAAPYLPPGMEGWFRRACAREPGDRHPSTREFIEELQAAAGAPGRVAAVQGSSPPGATLPSAPSGAGLSAPALRLREPGAASALPPAGTPLGQSAGAVSITSAGIPRRAVGPFVAGGALAGLFLLGATALFVLSPRREKPVAPSSRTVASSPADPSPTAGGPVLSAVAASGLGPDDAGRRAGGAPRARPSVPEVSSAPEPRSRESAPPAPCASPAPVAPEVHAPSSPISRPIARPSPPPIDVGY